MKRLFLTLAFIFTAPSFAGFQIISDFDDTIKRSNIPDGGARTVLNAPLFYKAYRGMPTLFQNLENEVN